MMRGETKFYCKSSCWKSDHLFADVKDLAANGRGHCDIHGAECAVPRVDVIISGTACTSISGERTSNADFATCFATGAGASGITYQSGYRDMIPLTKALVSLYENVKTVAERILAQWMESPWGILFESLFYL